MNTENILKTAARLRQEDVAEHFNMKNFFCSGSREAYSLPFETAIHTCNTAACIAGWAVVVAHPKQNFHDRTDSIYNMAAEFFGISDRTADELFIPDNVCFSSVTPAIAADVLEHLAATGEVEWPESVF